MNIKDKIEKKGLSFPAAPAKGGVYASVKKFGNNLYYISGCGSTIDGREVTGKLGKELSLEEGQQAAQRAMLNFLAAVEAHIGSLENVKSFVKLIVFVASDNEFFRQPEVANGATQLLVDVFGEEIGAPARSAIGVNVLPGNIPVEIEGIIEWEKKA